MRTISGEIRLIVNTSSFSCQNTIGIKPAITQTVSSDQLDDMPLQFLKVLCKTNPNQIGLLSVRRSFGLSVCLSACLTHLEYKHVHKMLQLVTKSKNDCFKCLWDEVDFDPGEVRINRLCRQEKTESIRCLGLKITFHTDICSNITELEIDWK